MGDAVVKLTDVWKIFGARADEAMAAVRNEGIGKPEVLQRFGCVVGVQGASFDVPRGEIFCIMGLSGSGKSTLVRHINRLIDPTAGSIEILGQDVSTLSDRELRRIRAQQIGMVFQHMALMPNRTVRDNVAYPLEIRKVSKSKRWAISDHALGLVDLTGYEDRLPSELSGGMQQRVAIARALATEAPILLLDEPTSALDIGHQQQALELVARLRADHGLTVISAMHDLTLAGMYAERLALLHEGTVVADGAADEVLHADTLAEFYGVRVTVHRDLDGTVVVIPRREHL